MTLKAFRPCSEGLIFVSFLTLLWMLLAIDVKRWHDVGKSGWWFWINLIPVMGTLIAVFYCGFVPGRDESNAYRTSPHRDLRSLDARP